MGGGAWVSKKALGVLFSGACAAVGQVVVVALRWGCCALLCCSGGSGGAAHLVGALCCAAAPPACARTHDVCVRCAMVDGGTARGTVLWLGVLQWVQWVVWQRFVTVTISDAHLIAVQHGVVLLPKQVKIVGQRGTDILLGWASRGPHKFLLNHSAVQATGRAEVGQRLSFSRGTWMGDNPSHD